MQELTPTWYNFFNDISILYFVLNDLGIDKLATVIFGKQRTYMVVDTYFCFLPNLDFDDNVDYTVEEICEKLKIPIPEVTVQLVTISDWVVIYQTDSAEYEHENDDSNGEEYGNYIKDESDDLDLDTELDLTYHSEESELSFCR